MPYFISAERKALTKQEPGKSITRGSWREVTQTLTPAVTARPRRRRSAPLSARRRPPIERVGVTARTAGSRSIPSLRDQVLCHPVSRKGVESQRDGVPKGWGHKGAGSQKGLGHKALGIGWFFGPIHCELCIVLKQSNIFNFQ